MLTTNEKPRNRVFLGYLYRKRWYVLGLMTLLLLAGCASDPSQREVKEDVFNVGESPRLEVDSENGQITVRSGGAGSVIKVTATIENTKRVTYATNQTGDTVTVVASVDNGMGLFNHDAGVNLDITVPEQIALDLKSSNGGVIVTGTNGPVTARTSNGKVEVNQVDGDVDARSSNGRINLVHVSGQVTAETSNGVIEMTGTLPAGSSNRLQTSNGGVSVVLEDTSGLNLDAQTNNGTINVDQPITTSGTPDPNHVVGAIGTGGPALEIRTSNGNISVK